MTEIGDFILRRLAEEEVERRAAPMDYNNQAAILSFLEEVVEFHKSWPVLVETPIEVDVKPNMDLNNFSLVSYKKIAWTTEQEYVKHFGSDPPSAFIIAKLANLWSDHPEFNPEWLL